MSPHKERYEWLRNGRSINSGYCGSAPFVMSPNGSRLFAIKALRGEQLDLEVDCDIFENKCHELVVSNAVVERGLLPEGVRASNMDDRYVKILSDLAYKELGWTLARISDLEDFIEKLTK